MVVTHYIVVTTNHRWTLTVHGKEVAMHKCSALSDTPTKLNLQSLQTLVLFLDKVNVCAGNPDEHLVAMAASKKGSRYGQKFVAVVDGHSMGEEKCPLSSTSTIDIQ